MGQNREGASAAVPIQTPKALDGGSLVVTEQITAITTPFDDKLTFTAFGTDDV
jgi:hypothetical protein